MSSRSHSSPTMITKFSARLLREVRAKALWKLFWNFGVGGIISVEKFKRRLKKGVHFPPFIYISVISGCNLKCQGCWVDVESEVKMLSRADLARIIGDARAHGNRYFGILGGEPFLHPEILDVFADHPDCYFQVFTNGQLITEKIASRLAELGNVSPLVSIEGRAEVSDIRRGRKNVLSNTLRGLDACLEARLFTGVASSICKSNFDELVREEWLRELIDKGVHYAWFHTYRPVGSDARPDLTLSPEEGLSLRKFIVTMRARLPIALVDAYYDDKGQALCPMATGVSHHISPYGDIEPCPIIQFAKENVHESEKGVFDLMKDSRLLDDFRKTARSHTQGCIVLERPDLVETLVKSHEARDTTQRQTALRELTAMQSRPSQYNPGNEIPEEHRLYKFFKKHWFFGFGAYT